MKRTLILAIGLALAGRAAAQDTSVAPTVLAGDGVRLRYVIRGKGADTTIVPLAAWMERSLEPLTRDRVVVFYDPRGRGGSSAPVDSNAYGWQRDVDDLEALRKHLRIGRASLVGWSYYGALVALYAGQHPERVSRVVMVGPQRPVFGTKYTHTPTERQKADSMTLATLASLRRTGGETNDPEGFCRLDVFARVMPAIMGDPDRAAQLADDPCAFENERPARSAEFWRRLGAANGRWDWRIQAQRVRAPTLIVHGEDDPAVPAGAGREWARRISQSRILIISGAGHAPWLDGAPLFFDAIGIFLDGDWPDGAVMLRGANTR